MNRSAVLLLASLFAALAPIIQASEIKYSDNEAPFNQELTVKVFCPTLFYWRAEDGSVQDNYAGLMVERVLEEWRIELNWVIKFSAELKSGERDCDFAEGDIIFTERLHLGNKPTTSAVDERGLFLCERVDLLPIRQYEISVKYELLERGKICWKSMRKERESVSLAQGTGVRALSLRGSTGRRVLFSSSRLFMVMLRTGFFKWLKESFSSMGKRARLKLAFLFGYKDFIEEGTTRKSLEAAIREWHSQSLRNSPDIPEFYDDEWLSSPFRDLVGASDARAPSGIAEAMRRIDESFPFHEAVVDRFTLVQTLWAKSVSSTSLGW